jgi:mono/diheme cytochrome c family protein
MNRSFKLLAVLMALACCSVLVMCGQNAEADKASSDKPATMTKEQMTARGKYLTMIAGCNDCHTPKKMGPKGPEFDMSRELSGHPGTDPIPEYPTACLSPTGWIGATNMHLSAWAGPWGISFAANLTPDQTTGTGAWTEDSFIEAMRTGKHMGMGREILPPMPWQTIGTMTDEDLKSIFTYIQSIKPVMNQVPEPIPPPGAPMGDASAH